MIGAYEELNFADIIIRSYNVELLDASITEKMGLRVKLDVSLAGSKTPTQPTWIEKGCR